MTMARQRALTVRPQNADHLLPVQGEESGETEVPGDGAEGGLAERFPGLFGAAFLEKV